RDGLTFGGLAEAEPVKHKLAKKADGAAHEKRPRRQQSRVGLRRQLLDETLVLFDSLDCVLVAVHRVPSPLAGLAACPPLINPAVDGLRDIIPPPPALYPG